MSKRYSCAVCFRVDELREEIPPGHVYCCQACFTPIKAAEVLRAERKNRKLAAWLKRQPKTRESYDHDKEVKP